MHISSRHRPFTSVDETNVLGGQVLDNLTTKSYSKQKSFPLSSPKQCPSSVRITTFLIPGNCFSVAFISAVTRASAPIPAELRLRQNFTVAVPFSVMVPFLSSVSLKSGPPTGRGAEQFDGPLSMVLSSV